MTPVKLYAYGAAVLVLVLLLSGAAIRLRQLREAAVQNESRGHVIEDTSAAVRDAAIIDKEQAARDDAIAAARNTFQQSKQKAIRNEPEIATRATRVVPVSVRDAFRERRLARERLGCVAAECRQDHEGDTAAKR